MSNENAEKLLTFIEQSPSAFHVVYNMRRQLDAAGFVYLPENKPMNIEYGKAYYTIRNDASLIAWRMPEQEPVGFHIAAAHSDSPAFLIKEHPEINAIVTFNEWTSLGVGWAIRGQGLADATRVVAFDSNVVNVGMLETGEVDALIVQNPYAMGYLGVEAAYRLLNGQKVTAVTDTDTVVVTRENMYDEACQRILFTFEE